MKRHEQGTKKNKKIKRPFSASLVIRNLQDKATSSYNFSHIRFEKLKTCQHLSATGDTHVHAGGNSGWKNTYSIPFLELYHHKDMLLKARKYTDTL